MFRLCAFGTDLLIRASPAEQDWHWLPESCLDVAVSYVF